MWALITISSVCVSSNSLTFQFENVHKIVNWYRERQSLDSAGVNESNSTWAMPARLTEQVWKCSQLIHFSALLRKPITGPIDRGERIFVKNSAQLLVFIIFFVCVFFTIVQILSHTMFHSLSWCEKLKIYWSDSKFRGKFIIQKRASGNGTQFSQPSPSSCTHRKNEIDSRHNSSVVVWYQRTDRQIKFFNSPTSSENVKGWLCSAAVVVSPTLP